MRQVLAISPEIDWQSYGWLGAALVGYLLVLLAGPTRRHFFDGVRALIRYPDLWAIPVLLALCYAAWQLAVQVFYFMVLSQPERPDFSWWYFAGFPDQGWDILFRRSVLSAAEGVSGLSAVFFTTYPVSALAGLLLLANWHGHTATLIKALRHRFGAAGWLLWLAILVGAVAAVIKPVTYAALPIWGQHAGLILLRGSLLIDWLSFLFETLLGVGLQTYLILLAYLWVRGKNFTREHLMDFAIRRFSVVLRWVGPVLLISSLLIHLSHLLMTFPDLDWPRALPLDTLVDQWLRPFFVVLLLVFFAVEIILVFHSESLRDAWRDNFRFIVLHPMPLLFFFSIAFFHFLILTVMGQAAMSAFGRNSLPGIVCQFGQAALFALNGGWLLASWVSLYQRVDAEPPAALT